MSRRPFAACLVSVLALCAPLPALASGFHVYEQGAKASAEAVAFIARADDATAAWYNPAGIVHLEDSWFAIGGSAIFLGNTTFDSRMDEVSPLFDGRRDDMTDNIGKPIHALYVTRLGEGPYSLAVSLTTPFGLVTQWEDGSDVRFSARKADLRTFVWNVNVARKLGDHFSVAAGIDYLDFDLRSFSRNISLRGINPALTQEPYFDLQGSGTKWGWNAAAQWKSERFAVGATYRSGFSVDLTGTLTVAGVPSVPLAPGFDLRQLFPSGPASGTVDLPAMYGVGFAFMPSSRFEVELDWHRIAWSSFEKLAIDVERNTALPTPGGLVTILGDTLLIEDWKDTNAYRLGGSFKVAERHALRAGVYTEESAIPRRHLRPSIPDADRFGYSLGYGFAGSSSRLDLYWMHIELDDVSTTLADSKADPSVPVGKYESSLDLVGVTVSWKM